MADGTISTTIPLLRSRGTVARPSVGTHATTLWVPRGRIKVTTVDVALHGNTKLRRLKTSIRLRMGGTVRVLAGEIRASGSTILTFLGPPDRTLLWELVDGGGALIPITDYTDAYGRASCLYQAGGFDGVVTVQVTYGG